MLVIYPHRDIDLAYKRIGDDLLANRSSVSRKNRQHSRRDCQSDISLTHHRAMHTKED